MSDPETNRISISSERSDESDNSNINDDLPAIGLAKGKTKDAKSQKNVTYDFAVNVIMKSGKYSGMGTLNVIESSTLIEKTRKLRRSKEELQQVLTQFEQDLEHLMEQEQNDELIQVHQVKPQKKGKSAAERSAKNKAAKLALEAKRKEVEAKREVIRKAIVDEKQAKADLEEANKIFKPGECMQHMTVRLHPSLAAAWYMQPTLEAVREQGVRLEVVEDIFEPGLVMWTRLVPRKLLAQDGQVRLSRRGMCGHSVLVTTLAEAAARAAQNTLVRHVADTKQLSPDCRALLVLIDGNKRDFGMSRKKIINDLLLELLISCKMDVVVAQTPADLASLVLHYTRAVAEEPYKKAKRDIDECADFYMRGDNKNCVTVDKQGNGVSRLWQQMVAVLPHSSLEVARSLAAQYTAPAALIQEFQSPGGEAKVADVGVSRTNVPGAKTRRIGPEFARKLHTLFTTEDGNTVIE